MKKPLVDDIQGLCPAVAIEQKVNTRNPRSTVATSTEIYDYIKLLFSRAGHTISPISGREVKRETTEDVLKFCSVNKSGERALIMAPQPLKNAMPPIGICWCKRASVGFGAKTICLPSKR